MSTPSVIVKMTGDKKLSARIAALESKVSNKIMRAAVSKGLIPIAKQAKANQRHASLRKLIGKKVITKKRWPKDVAGKVYMKPSKDRTIMLEGRNVGFEVVANILEFGSAKRNITPQPFMRPARTNAAAAAISATAAEARRQLQKLGAK